MSVMSKLIRTPTRALTSRGRQGEVHPWGQRFFFAFFLISSHDRPGIFHFFVFPLWAFFPFPFLPSPAVGAASPSRSSIIIIIIIISSSCTGFPFPSHHVHVHRLRDAPPCAAWPAPVKVLLVRARPAPRSAAPPHRSEQRADGSARVGTAAFEEHGQRLVHGRPARVLVSSSSRSAPAHGRR